MAVEIVEGHCAKCSDPGTSIAKGHVFKGEIVDYEGIRVYKTGSESSGLYLVYATDVFGIKADNNRIMADLISEIGCCVLMPDYFHGDPMDFKSTHEELMMQMPAWAEKHPLDPCIKETTDLFDKLDAKPTTKGIYVIGFCYGALPMLNCMIKTSPKLLGGILAHPSRINLFTAAKEIKKPLHLILAERDPAFPPDVKEAICKEIPEGLVSESWFPNTDHGFSIRPDESEHGHKMQRAALEAMKKFFVSLQ